MDRDLWMRQYSFITENPEHEDFDLIWEIYDSNCQASMHAFDNMSNLETLLGVLYE